ncbi:MAG: p19 [Mucilaginibacter sp.]|nr:p19 [Mucilaginibacter sp.]
MDDIVLDISNEDSFWDRLKNQSARETLIKLFFLFLPFGQALTLNIVFPLKLSEISLVLLVLHEIATGNFLNWKLSRPILLSFLFIFIVLVSVFVNIFYRYNYPLSLEYSRINPAIDSIMKFFYVMLALLGMLVTRNALIQKPSLIKWFFIGAIVSSIYCWYLFISGVLRIPAFLLPGMENPPQVATFNGIDIIRVGTFKEGNYMGFYLLLSAILALYYRKTKLSIFLFITIITTFSTTSIFCFIIFIVFYFIKKYKKYKIKLIVGFSIIAVVIVSLVQVSEAFRTIFYNKIFGNEDSVENQNDLFSKADRLNSTIVGLSIFTNNPVLGIGLSNYGLHYKHYNAAPDFELLSDTKRIPNNIYIEILSECGLLSLIVFAAFLYVVFREAKHKSNGILTAGLIAACVYFFAFPTFTMLFIWVFLGVILS